MCFTTLRSQPFSTNYLWMTENLKHVSLQHHHKHVHITPKTGLLHKFCVNMSHSVQNEYCYDQYCRCFANQSYFGWFQKAEKSWKKPPTMLITCVQTHQSNIIGLLVKTYIAQKQYKYVICSRTSGYKLCWFWHCGVWWVISYKTNIPQLIVFAWVVGTQLRHFVWQAKTDTQFRNKIAVFRFKLMYNLNVWLILWCPH